MNGAVVWITGLSGSGKTTLAHEVVDKLKERGVNPILLDGDELREMFGRENHYERRLRLYLALNYSKLCKMLAAQDIIVVIATISLFKEIHNHNRATLPNYTEIYLKVPMEELKKRDKKGVYSQNNVVGVDIPFDEPENPDFIVTHTQKFDEVSDDIILHLKLKGVI